MVVVVETGEGGEADGEIAAVENEIIPRAAVEAVVQRAAGQGFGAAVGLVAAEEEAAAVGVGVVDFPWPEGERVLRGLVFKVLGRRAARVVGITGAGHDVFGVEQQRPAQHGRAVGEPFLCQLPLVGGRVVEIKCAVGVVLGVKRVVTDYGEGSEVHQRVAVGDIVRCDTGDLRGAAV